MALIIKHALGLYWELTNVYDDERVRSWFLMSTPFKPMAFLGIYLYFVLKWGPRHMENRKPMQLDWIMKYYNLLQVILCGLLAVDAYRFTYARNYSFICEPVDFSYSPEAIRIAKIAHCYFLIKVIDLMDTVFFVLRKKQNQVTFLHVYHHAGMVALSWIGTKYLGGGHSVFMGLINSIVHVVMYLYYYLTSVDKKYRNSSWKKYITQLQMIQFALIALHWLSLRLSPDCGFPKWPTLFLLPQNFFMFVLFYDFYRKSYNKPPPAASAASTDNQPIVDVNNNMDEKEYNKNVKQEKTFILNFEKNISM